MNKKNDFKEFDKLSIEEKKLVLQNEKAVAHIVSTFSTNNIYRCRKFLITNNLSTKLFDKLRNEYIESIFSDEMKVKTFKSYELQTLVLDYYFKELSRNASLTIETIKDLVQDCPRNCISFEGLGLLQFIEETLLSRSTPQNVVETFNFLKEKSLKTDLMALYNLAEIKAKNKVAEMLVDSVQLPERFQIKDIENQDISEYKNDTSQDKDEKFAFFTHTHKISHLDITKEEILNNWFEPKKINREEISLCYISDLNPTPFPTSDRTITFLFTQLNPENFIRITPTNCFSLSKMKFKEGLYSPETFAKVTHNFDKNGIPTEKNFNEIVYKKTKSDKTSLVPNGILCREKTPTQLEITYAKAFNVDLYYFDEKCYKTQKDEKYLNKYALEPYL